MSVLATLAGLGVVLIPLLYGLLMLGIWAGVERPRLRRGLLFALGALGALVVLRVPALKYYIGAAEDAFNSACESSTSPQIFSRVPGVNSVAARFIEYPQESDVLSYTATVAFPHHQATAFLLTGARPFGQVLASTPLGHLAYSIGTDGQEQQAFTKGPADTRYGYEWKAVDSDDGKVLGADLLIKDYKVDRTLAIQRVFVQSVPALNLLPTLARTTQLNYGVAGFRTCPEPYEISVFIKSVLQPAIKQ